MKPVVRPRGDSQAGPDDGRGEEVGGRLDRVGREGMGMPRDASDELDCDQGRIREQACEGSPHASGCPAQVFTPRLRDQRQSFLPASDD
jgi:hypothetical protein